MARKGSSMANNFPLNIISYCKFVGEFQETASSDAVAIGEVMLILVKKILINRHLNLKQFKNEIIYFITFIIMFLSEHFIRTAQLFE